MIKKDAIVALEKLMEDVDKLQFGDEKNLDIFLERSKMVVRKIFGSNSVYLDNLKWIQFSPLVSSHLTDESDCIKAFDRDKVKATNLLQVMIDDLDFSEDEEVVKDTKDIWFLIHPSVVEVSKERFDTGNPGQRADAVESAFKEINERMKKYYRKRTGKELDGDDLINQAFSGDKPLICVDDLSTKTGKNRQRGYWQIFAGSMQAIRNPKAHSNIELDEKRTIHFLFLASLLMDILDEAKV